MKCEKCRCEIPERSYLLEGGIVVTGRFYSINEPPLNITEYVADTATLEFLNSADNKIRRVKNFIFKAGTEIATFNK